MFGVKVLYLVTICLISQGAQALPLVTREILEPLSKRGGSAGAVSFNLNSNTKTKTKTKSTTSKFLNSKVVNKSVKSKNVTLEISNDVQYYSMDVCIGNPCQTVTVQIDTGSSDFFVISPEVLSDKGSNNSEVLTYNPSDSNSSIVYNETFSIAYGDGSNASGILVRDDIHLGDGIDIPKATFELAESAAGLTYGVSGLGFLSLEVTNKEYYNLPYLLKYYNYTSTIGYSLYLAAQEDKSGQIIFGGVDTDKFDGSLTQIDMLKRSPQGLTTDDYEAFFVTLDSVSTDGEVLNEDKYDTLIDCGSTEIYLPGDGADNYAAKFATYTEALPGYLCDCNATGDDLIFTLQNASISVPFDDLLIPVSSGGNPYKINGIDQCSVGVVSTQSDYATLGAVFLRSAYVYFDLDRKIISFAQVKYTNSSNMVLDYFESS